VPESSESRRGAGRDAVSRHERTID
jgi:hypothetical protein